MQGALPAGEPRPERAEYVAGDPPLVRVLSAVGRVCTSRPPDRQAEGRHLAIEAQFADRVVPVILDVVGDRVFRALMVHRGGSIECGR